jgi:MinD-like ATPase involved in chromosome partitioning or flagellar assembly
MERPTVLLAMTEDTREHVRALNGAGFDPTVIDPESAEDADPRSWDLAVIDCDINPRLLVSLYDSLQADGSVPTLLLVGPNSEIPSDLKGGAADEVALKPVAPEPLVYRLQALLIRAGRHLPTESGAWASADSLTTAPIAGEGHAISIFAPKGGVGKTTLAVNMAVAIRQQTRSEVLLFDADVGVGNVTAVLDVPYRMGLADLADSAPEEWTDAAFEHAVSTHALSGVRVLTWGTDPAESERVTVDLLLAALRWGRKHYSFVIIDNHPGYDDRTMAMLAVSNEIFLVVTPEMGALRNSAQFLDLARELGLANVVRVIINRANHGIRVADMSTSLKMPIAATIVSSGPKAVIASNEGMPVILKFPKERISNDLHAVARLVTQPNAPAPAPVASRRRWSLFGARASQAGP